MKKYFWIFLLMLLIFGCGEKKEDTSSQSDENRKEIKKNYKIGLALSYGGIDDEAFNYMQYEGLMRFSGIYPEIETVVETAQNPSEESAIKSVERLLDAECDLIIASGSMLANSIYDIAEENPKTMFFLLDTKMELRDNLSTAIYSQNEGSFVVGALSALMTKTNKVGFIGGVDIPVIKDFLIGYREGIEYINKETVLDIKFVTKFPDFTGFNYPEEGKKIALNMYENGVDIIFAVAGGTNNGIIEVAREKEKYLIGVDSNQDKLAKGLILTSMMKRLDVTVFDISEKFIYDKLEGNKEYIYDYKNSGIGITNFEYTRKIISEEIIRKIREIEEKIRTDELKVSTYEY